jgi:hypothetical protein
MRKQIVLVMIAFWGSLLVLKAQDFNATGTAISRGATETARAEANQPQAEPTEDPFVLTATALVRAATQTAEVSTGRTAAPITAQAESEDFELTATALVVEATQLAGGNATQSQPDADDSNAQAMSGAVVMFGGLIVVLVLLGAGFVVMSRRSESGKRG